MASISIFFPYILVCVKNFLDSDMVWSIANMENNNVYKDLLEWLRCYGKWLVKLVRTLVEDYAKRKPQQNVVVVLLTSFTGGSHPLMFCNHVR